MNREFSGVKKKSQGVDKVERYSWIVTDCRGKYADIQKESLQIDYSYQRIITNKVKILRMASRWSWGSCNTLCVAKRDNGELFVYDGQYRWSAAMLRSDIDTLPCMIFPSKGSKAEAEAFLSVNTDRKFVSSTDRFKAALHAQKPTEVFIDGYIKKWGFVYGDSDGINTIRCLGTLGYLAKNPDNFSEVFDFTASICQGKCQLTSNLLKGLAYIHQHCEGGGLRNPKLRKRLIMVGAEDLEQAACRNRTAQGIGGERILALGMMERVNKNLQTRFLLV